MGRTFRDRLLVTDLVALTATITAAFTMPAPWLGNLAIVVAVVPLTSRAHPGLPVAALPPPTDGTPLPEPGA
jgi:hypothetical protein